MLLSAATGHKKKQTFDCVPRKAGTTEGTNEGIRDGNEERILEGNVDPGGGRKITGDNVTPPLGPLTVGDNVIGD